MAGKKKKLTGKESSLGKKSPLSKKKGSGKTLAHDDSPQHHHAGVYIDVEFDRGLIYLVLINDGDQPAVQLSVAFDKPLYGANGTDVSALGIFKHLAFLAPGKRIRIFLDDAHAYYARRQRSVVKFEVSWRIDRSPFTATIRHDMRAYADFPYIVEQPDNRRLGHVGPR